MLSHFRLLCSIIYHKPILFYSTNVLYFIADISTFFLELYVHNPLYIKITH